VASNPQTEAKIGNRDGLRNYTFLRGSSGGCAYNCKGPNGLAEQSTAN